MRMMNTSSTVEHQLQTFQKVSSAATEVPPQNQQGNMQNSLSQISIHQEGWNSSVGKDNITSSNSLGQGEWMHPSSAQLIGYHDCRSLAYAWGLGNSTSSLDGPTGASQAQSPSEDDPGDGKSNEILSNCPSFRNELGANAAEIAVLEDVSNVYLGGKLCAERQPKIVIEPQDVGSYLYRHCFAGRNHVEYGGYDETYGPCLISMVREEIKDESNQHTIYRVILRVSDVLIMRVAVPEEAIPDISQDRSTRNLMRDLLETVCPQIHFGSLRPIINIPKVEEMLLKIDEQPNYSRYKVGVLLAKMGQSTEEQMYNNELSSPSFEEFLDFLGTRVRLKGFLGYPGGLDTRGDTTGTHSIYTEHHSAQIMFHVSTMLPFSPNNKQQLARKRHCGNDMVTIVFQEPGALPFSPITVRSHFQHVFIVIRVLNPLTENVAYRVAVSRAKDVPSFGPALSPDSYQKNAQFKEFLLTKIINAENAVHRSPKFASMAARTRREALKELVENYATHHTNEGASRIASRLLGGGGSMKMKKETRITPKPVLLDAGMRAAISWQVEIFDHSLDQRKNAILGLSADWLVLLDIPSGQAIFATHTHSILGWIQTDGGLKIFYDHGELLQLVSVSSPDGSEREMGFLIKRLTSVTNGDEAKEVILRKNKPSESFGFHLQEEGIITEVNMSLCAWRVGLRQGSRIVEIEDNALIKYTTEYISKLLIERTQLKMTMISPGADGNPRRGCEDATCPAIRGQECQPVSVADTFAHQQEKDNNQRQQMPQRISSSSDSWSGVPSTTSLAALPERKKHSAPAFGIQDKQNRPPPAKSSVDSSNVQQQKFRVSQQQQHYSEDGQFSKSQSTTTFNRTRSDDIKPEIDPMQLSGQGPSVEETVLYSMTTQASSSVSPLSTHPIQEARLKNETEQEDNEELVKCRCRQQKTMDENKDLALEVEQLKAQLTFEQRAHENTRRHLQAVIEYCERFSIIPPPFEEEDEEL